MNLTTVIKTMIEPAYRLLPSKLATERATVSLLANGLQESRFEHTYQVVEGRPDAKGPARGYWQFEQGTAKSRGGVWGVFLHPASKAPLEELCRARDVIYAPTQIWRALETDHVLAAGVARLLLYTDPRSLPPLGDAEGAMKLYLRTWRPGAHSRGTDTYRNELEAKFLRNYALAMKAVTA